MYKIKTTNQFEKDVVKCCKRGFKLELLKKVMQLLAEKGKLPPQYRSHKLSGNYAECWECHIKGDWLLIWKQDDDSFTLLFLNTGTHSDLF